MIPPKNVTFLIKNWVPDRAKMKKIFFASGENKKAMAKVHNKELKTLIWLIIKKKKFCPQGVFMW